MSAARGAMAGATLVEILASVAIFAAMLGGLLGTLERLQRLERDAARAGDLRVRARAALDRIVRELQDAGVSTLAPQPLAPVGASGISYQRAAGFAAGNVVHAPPSRLEFRLEPGELEDGIDNDGDGLIDEGEVVWTRNEGLAGEERYTLVTGVARLGAGESANALDDNGNGLVDEAGLSFELRLGGALRVRLTLERAGAGGRVARETAQTTVQVRNP